jgi:hypothetical protein
MVKIYLNYFRKQERSSIYIEPEALDVYVFDVNTN